MDTTPIPPKMHISKKIPILIGLVVAALVIVVLLGRGGLTKASDDKPLDVTISPNSPNSVKITWTTGSSDQGQILYSNNMDAVLSCKTTDSASKATPDYAPEESPTTDHSKTIEGLQAGATYYFRIQIGSSCFDNDGVPWSFSTSSTDGTSDATSSAKPKLTIPAKTLSATPVQHLVIPNSTSGNNSVTTAPTAASCKYTSCSTIKTKFGQGCSTQDYIRCLRKAAASPTP